MINFNRCNTVQCFLSKNYVHVQVYRRLCFMIKQGLFWVDLTLGKCFFLFYSITKPI